MPVGRSTILDNPWINHARSRASNALGYSQAKRYSNGNYFDCSSFVQDVYGIPENIVTATMPTILPKHGYTFVKGLEGLQPGDILWRNGHTEIYTGDGYTIGAHSTKNGVSEYKYRGNLDQYAGYFRPPQSPFSFPAQTPAPIQSGSQVAQPQAMDAQQHEPAPNQTWLGNGYKPAGVINPFSLFMAVMNSNPYTQQAFAPIANIFSGQNLSWTL